ncbi:MAG: winged helix-turn-helix domain-containing protein [Candidatus Thorarchaeota archaeon]|nr:winged helix-turn-helix domain-containing protein [Candidatus Thorarchaeota archaeon]
MNPKRSTSKHMKDLEIITDPNTIKVLFDKMRAIIVFKYLVNQEMTVKQLADAVNKNPGNILRHIERLKTAGLVKQVRTEETNTGIVQRFYRATAREYRLGIADMMKSDEGVKVYAKDRLSNMIQALEAYGINIPEEKMDEAINLLKNLVESENKVSAGIPITNQEFWNELPKHQQDDASWLMRDLFLLQDSEHIKARRKWSEFLRSFMQ